MVTRVVPELRELFPSAPLAVIHRSDEAHTHNAPHFLLTSGMGATEAGMVRSWDRLGADVFITEPISPDSLQARLIPHSPCPVFVL